MYMFLDRVKVHLGFSSLSLFDFIVWLGCKWGEGGVFCVSLFFFGLRCLVYIMYTFMRPSLDAFSTIAFTYKKKWLRPIPGLARFNTANLQISISSCQPKYLSTHFLHGLRSSKQAHLTLLWKVQNICWQKIHDYMCPTQI